MEITRRYRIKDSTSRKKLNRLSSWTNYTWNYINDLYFKNIKTYHKFLSEFDINYYLTGSSKEIPLHSTTFQEISKYYSNNRNTFKKAKLNWRSYKYSLGWIPFKASAIKLDEINNIITYNKNTFKYYNSRKIDGKIKTGSFSQDARGRWYINLVVEIDEKPIKHEVENIGVDLGIKCNIALSDGEIFSRENLTKRHADRLAKAQRAKKKKQVRNIHRESPAFRQGRMSIKFSFLI